MTCSTRPRGARRADQQRRRIPRAVARPARARALGADEIEVVNDSELVAKQVNGLYKVKHPAMRPLHAEALHALEAFDRWGCAPCGAPHNAGADALVNQALDAPRLDS